MIVIENLNRGGKHLIPILLHHGANVNPPARGSSSYLPLLNACKFRASGVVRQLLECGAHVDAQNAKGKTALHAAAAHSDGATVRLLLSHGASVERRYNGKTPLLIAAFSGNIDAVRVLLEHDANVNVVDSNYRNVLHSVMDEPELLRILLNHCRGTMTEDNFEKLLLQPDRYGSSALHFGESLETLQLLVEQPRRQGQHLLSACHAQLVRQNNAVDYLDTFRSLVLSIPVPEATSTSSTAQRRRLRDRIAVKLNPALNDFQRSVAEEAAKLIMDATGFPDRIAYAILGCLTPLDVMKRSDDVDTTASRV